MEPDHALPREKIERNYILLLLEVVTFFIAAALLSHVTILPLFASNLTDRPEVIGIIPSLYAFGMILPAILGARLLRQRTAYRPFVFQWVIVERSALFLALISIALLRNAPPAVLLTVPLFFFTLWWCAMGVNLPGYGALLERCVPTNRRGRLMGWGFGLGGVAAFLAASFAGYLLTVLPFPWGFVACGAFALLSLMFGVLVFYVVNEAPLNVEPEPETGSIGLRAAFREDRDFVRFIISQVLFSFQALPYAIWTIYALQRFDASPRDIAQITAIIGAGGAVGSLAAGWLADRYGNRFVILMGTFVAAMSPLLLYLAPNLQFYQAAFIPEALGVSAVTIAAFNILMEFAPRGQVPRYIAIHAATVGPVRVLAPFAGGYLSQFFSYGLVFLLASAACVVAVVAALFFREPRLNSTSPGNHTDSGLGGDLAEAEG